MNIPALIVCPNGFMVLSYDNKLAKKRVDDPKRNNYFKVSVDETRRTNLIHSDGSI